MVSTFNLGSWNCHWYISLYFENHRKLNMWNYGFFWGGSSGKFRDFPLKNTSAIWPQPRFVFCVSESHRLAVFNVPVIVKLRGCCFSISKQHLDMMFFLYCFLRVYSCIIDSCTGSYPHLTCWSISNDCWCNSQRSWWVAPTRCGWIPSGKHSQFAIENGHRNSEFSH